MLCSGKKNIFRYLTNVNTKVVHSLLILYIIICASLEHKSCSPLSDGRTNDRTGRRTTRGRLKYSACILPLALHSIFYSRWIKVRTVRGHKVGEMKSEVFFASRSIVSCSVGRRTVLLECVAIWKFTDVWKKQNFTIIMTIDLGSYWRKCIAVCPRADTPTETISEQLKLDQVRS